MKKSSLFLILTVFTLSLWGQSIAVGQWQDQLPYNNTQNIEVVGNLIYAQSPYSIFSYDKESYEITRFSKVNGLSDSEFSIIHYNTATNSILIGYNNGNIDILTDTDIINISDIKRHNIIGDKRINGVMSIGSTAYLSCGFGIVVLDMTIKKIIDTYYIGDQGKQVFVNNMSFDGEYLYAATNEGIYYADINHPSLSFYEAWNKVDNIPNKEGNYTEIVTFNETTYTSISYPEGEMDSLYYLNKTTNEWLFQPGFEFTYIQSIRYTEDQLIMTLSSTVDVYNNDLQLQYTVNNPAYLPWSRYYDAILDNQGDLWYGCGQGLVFTSNNGTTGEHISVNGPYNVDIFSLTSGGTNLWVASGGHKADYSKIYSSNGVYTHTDDSWINYNGINTDAFDTITDPIVCAVNPRNNAIAYVGTWGNGVMMFENGNVTSVFDYSNSSLGEVNGWAGKTMISGLAFDSENNLWVCNSNTENLLSKLDVAGNWEAFTLSEGATSIDTRELVIDQEDNKWIITRASGTLYCFNENSTNTDRYGNLILTRKLTNSPGYGNLPGTAIHAVAVDKDGEVWLGSDAGIGVIYNPEDVLSDEYSYDAQQILVEWDGYNGYLLATELVSCIAVNGANEKWIGTDRSGVYKISPDGTEQVFHFTEENSPLFSNAIIDIDIDADGIVYIGTDKGIIAYRDDATDGNEENGSDIYAFPNPVNPEYNGLISIKGVVSNAHVRITDVAGNLVYSVTANGGQATWNGKNFHGQRVQTGIYLVFITNDDGSETEVTKILFVN